MLRRFFLLTLLAAGACGALFFVTLPNVSDLATSFPKTTSFMERRKAELARAGQSTRLEWIPVSLSRISAALRRAVIIAEDSRFYEHDGVDWEAVRVALEKDWERQRLSLGASTITQQLAKNLYLSQARTPLAQAPRMEDRAAAREDSFEATHSGALLEHRGIRPTDLRSRGGGPPATSENRLRIFPP